MYHHHSQQQGPQPFSNGPRPHQQPPSNQHQNRTPSDMLSQVMGFQFPRPTQLPDELESALAIRGARDMDHRLIDHMNPPNQGPGSGISQPGTYGSNPVTLTADNQPGHQQGVDWSSYQPPTKLFASPSPSTSRQHQGSQQQPESSHTGTSIPSWTAPVSDSLSPQVRHPHGSGSGGTGDGQGLYTPESAGSILASFGLSNEDLEVLSHYPDDQLTPDTLPFILRDIQINKSGNQKTLTSTSSSSFSCSILDVPLPPCSSSTLARSHSPEVPSLLTVTQTAGKVIDYGHASRAKDESSTRETFKREPLSNERTVKMYPALSSSLAAPKADKADRRQVSLEHNEPSKHGDQDYRRTSSDHRKTNRSPRGELLPLSKSRNLDRDYRNDGPKPRPTSETRGEDSSRRSLSFLSGSKPHSSNKKLPTPTMISDFSAVSPKVYPHICSLCHIQCGQEKDWFDHINTVNHTAACRDLRNKYPDWKPNLPSRSGQYGRRALWDPKDNSPSHSMSRSLSPSPTPSPPPNKHRMGPHPHRPHGKLYSPHHHPRYHRYTEHSHRLELRHSHSPPHSHRTSSSPREHRPEKRDRESTGGSSRSSVKHPHDDSTQCFTDTSRNPSSSKTGHSLKHGSSQSNTKTVKSGTKTRARMPKMASAKATESSTKPPPAKKKKKMVTPASQDWTVADRLVYLTGIPNDASEQEVTDLVGSFGKINNVILMPWSEEESEKGEGQKASVCMVKAEDAQALANSTNLSIRFQQISASTAKKPEGGQSSDANNSTPASGQDKGAAGEDSGGEAEQKTFDEKGMVLITGLPESSWSESDIIKLIQPFGSPSDIILATQIGKVLVSVPDLEIAQEIVKVHTFIPAKIKDSELKIIHLKQHIGLSTPVALYNLLMGSLDPLESPVPVGWSSLLVISNVPNTPSGSSEVEKLVRRFGTVIKTLVLNNTVICQMATAAMALSVYKRFQMFPCIIQNNPLFFSRKPDLKDMPTNGKSSQTTAAADEEETTYKEKFESPLEGKEKYAVGTDEKKKSTERMVGEYEDLGENWSKEEIKKVELSSAISNSLAGSDVKLKEDLVTDMRETSAVKTVTETTEENKAISASKAGHDKTPACGETKLSSSDGKSASREMFMSELPEVTQEMVNALLVECRTRTTSHPDNIPASTGGVKGETEIETEQGEKKAAHGTKDLAKNFTEEEMKQERERKDREARKEKEVRERERKERDRRAWEKEERAEREWDERARREREKREEARRQWERRERERRERKRAYSEALSGSRSSCRSEGYKQSSWRDVQYNNSETDTKMVVVKEEEEEEFDFPLNMSDFVTVDEVGDVTDLPRSPFPVVHMEIPDGGQDGGQNAPWDTQRGTSLEVDTETTMLDAAVILLNSNEQVSEPEPVSAPTESSDSLVLSDLTPSLILTAAETPLQASQTDSSTSQTDVSSFQPEASETATTKMATLDSNPEVESLSMPVASASGNLPKAVLMDSPANTPVLGAVTAESEEDRKDDNALIHIQAKEEVVVVDKTEEQEKMQDREDKEMAAPAAETGKQEMSKDQTNAEEECVKKKLHAQTPMSPDYSFPPFDPSKPVGMDFLVPKTGFFCKVCNRFFSGNKEAEINHCKTVKHYNNLQKYLQTMKTVNVTAKP